MNAAPQLPSLSVAVDRSDEAELPSLSVDVDGSDESELPSPSVAVDWSDESELPSPSVAVDWSDEPQLSSSSSVDVDRSDEPPAPHVEAGLVEETASGDVAVDDEPRIQAVGSGDWGAVGGGFPAPLPGLEGELEDDAPLHTAYVAPALVPDIASPQVDERAIPAPAAEAGDEGRERVAEMLEQVAERVRRGEIVPVTDANAGPAAVLASVLASLLSASR